MSQKVKKQITFTTQTIKLSEERAKFLGLDFPEYVRYVLTKNIDDNILEIPNKTTLSNIRSALLEDESEQIDEEEFKKTIFKNGDEKKED